MGWRRENGEGRAIGPRNGLTQTRNADGAGMGEVQTAMLVIVIVCVHALSAVRFGLRECACASYGLTPTRGGVGADGPDRRWASVAATSVGSCARCSPPNQGRLLHTHTCALHQRGENTVPVCTVCSDLAAWWTGVPLRAGGAAAAAHRCHSIATATASARHLCHHQNIVHSHCHSDTHGFVCIYPWQSLALHSVRPPRAGTVTAASPSLPPLVASVLPSHLPSPPPR